MHVKRVDLTGPRYGNLYGIMYRDNQISGNKIEKIDDVLKRGMWHYDLTDSAFTEQTVKLDNGVTMDLGHT